MAATLDDVLEQLKKMNQNISDSNKSTSIGNTGSGGYNLLSNIQSYRTNKQKQRRAQNLANIASTSKNSQHHASGLRNAANNYKVTKMNAVGAIAKEAAGMVNQITNTVYTVLNNNLKKQSIRIEAAAEMQNRAIDAWGKAMGSVTKAQGAFLTETVLDSSYASLNSFMEMGKTMQIKTSQDTLTVAKQNAEITKLNIDNANTIQKTASSVIGGISGMFGPVGALVSAGIGVISNATDQQLEREKMKIDQEMLMETKLQESREKIINQVNESVQSLIDTSKKVVENFNKLSTRSFQYGRSLFLSSNNLQAYNKSMFNINVAMANFGMTLKDYYKMQGSYSERNGGRTSIIGTREAEGMAALSKVLGISPEDAASINGALNIFNTSIEDGNQLIYSMSKNAAKMGLNATKYAKDLEKNLKLAEKYQFKGGVKGVMEMSAWAQKMRVDMTTFSGAIEKLRSGNIEDVMQTSARLNVLGGNAALYSDPMSMLYNVYADPGQHMKNIAKMVEGYGHFNKKTGEVTFDNITENMRMEAIAQANNMSREEMFNLARQAKKEQIIRSSYGNKFGDKTDFVTQNATWSQDKKDWVVKVKDGKGGFKEEKLSDLNGENDGRLEKIFPEDKQEQIIDIITSIRDLLSPEEAGERAQRITEAKSQQAAYGDIMDTQYAMADNQEKFANIQSNIDNYAESIRVTQVHAEEAQQLMQKLVSEGHGVKLLEKVLEGNTNAAQNFYNDMFDPKGPNGFAAKIINSAEDMYVTIEEIIGKYKEEFLEGAKLQGIAGDTDEIKGTLSEEEIKKMTELEWDTLLKEYGMSGISDSKQKKLMKNGYIRMVNGQLQTWDGKIVHMEDEAKYAKEVNEQWESGDYPRFYTNPKNIPGKADVYWNKETQQRRVNDAFWTPQGEIITDPKDVIGYIAAKPGGDFSQELGKNQIPQNINLTVNGTLKLDSGRQSIDLLDVLRNDPNALRELAKEIIIEGSRTTFGGKHQWAPNRYTFGN